MVSQYVLSYIAQPYDPDSAVCTKMAHCNQVYHNTT